MGVVGSTEERGNDARRMSKNVLGHAWQDMRCLLAHTCALFFVRRLSCLPPLLQGDEKAVKAFGVEHGAEMCRALLAAGAPGLHFYTLNLEKVRVLVLTGGMRMHACMGACMYHPSLIVYVRTGFMREPASYVHSPCMTSLCCKLTPRSVFCLPLALPT